MTDRRDPTELLCRVTSPNSQITPQQLKDLSPRRLNLAPVNPVENITFVDINAEDEYIYCDQVNYSKLIQARVDLFSELKKKSDWYDSYTRYRNIANPFEHLTSIFMNRASIKLANIDAVFNITKHSGGYVRWYTEAAIGRPADPDGTAPEDGVFRFCDIAGGPGGFTQYIQWRRTGAIGFGITLISADKSLNWKFDRLSTDTFTVTNGADGTGNLFTNSDSFVKTVRDSINAGVDLAVADGGFETDEDLKEVTTTHLVLAEILTALRTLKIGGTFVIKTYDTVTKASRDLLLIIALCFQHVWIFKPISSRPANSEQYVVAKNYKGDVASMLFITILQALNTQLTSDPSKKLKSIFNNDAVPLFDDWLIENNDIAIRRQYQQTLLIGALSRGIRAETDVVKYDMHRASISWNIPDEVRSDKVNLADFPYQRKFMPSIDVMFENLKKFEPRINSEPYQVGGVSDINTVTVDPERPGKPLFHLRPNDSFSYVSFNTSRGEYYRFMAISDHFNEPVRMAARKDKYESPVEWWSKPFNKKKIIDKIRIEKKKLNIETLHEQLYLTVHEASQFAVSIAKGVMSILLPTDLNRRPRMLDPSSGWGDRLITAISMDIEYLGFDPNTDLRTGNDMAISLLGDPRYQKIIYQPFERADLSQELPFDLVFTSPPFFDIEQYTTIPGQSILSYPTYNSWVEQFFKVMLLKSWAALRVGGYMAIHISDVRGRLFTTVLRQYMQTIGATYMGIIGYGGSGSGSATSIFVWLKQT